MTRWALLCGAAAATIAAAPQQAAQPTLAARIAAMPKNLPRAEGPSLDEAIDAARAAHAACVKEGVKVSVLVADSAGETIVLISGDGAGVRSQLIARTKVNIVVRYKMSSGDVATKAASDKNLTAEAASDPDIGVLRGGGFPVIRGGRMIAAVAVSGGTLGGKEGLDEKCAMVAVRRLERR